MKPYSTKIQKAAQKVKIDYLDALGMIAYEHETKNFSQNTKMSTMELEFKEDTIKRLTQISKALKIDFNSVVVYLLIKKLQEKE